MRKFLQIILLGLSSCAAYGAEEFRCPDIETQLKVEVQSDDIVKICNDQYIQYFSKEWKIPVAVVEKLEESDFKKFKEILDPYKKLPIYFNNNADNVENVINTTRKIKNLLQG